MTVSLYTLSPYVILPQCPPDGEAVRQALRLAAHDFFRRTGAWRASLTATPGTGALSATLALPEGFSGNLGRLWRVSVNDGTGYAKLLPLEDLTLTPDLALSWTMWNPDSTDTITADCSLWPDLETTLYPEDLVSRWKVALIAKAKATLLLMSGQPWADPKAAGECLDAYESEVRRTTGGNSLIGRRFATTRPRHFAGPLPALPVSQRGSYLPRTAD